MNAKKEIENYIFSLPIEEQEFAMQILNDYLKQGKIRKTDVYMLEQTVNSII